MTPPTNCLKCPRVIKLRGFWAWTIGCSDHLGETIATRGSAADLKSQPVRPPEWCPLKEDAK